MEYQAIQSDPLLAWPPHLGQIPVGQAQAMKPTRPQDWLVHQAAA